MSIENFITFPIYPNSKIALPTHCRTITKSIPVKGNENTGCQTGRRSDIPIDDDNHRSASRIPTARQLHRIGTICFVWQSRKHSTRFISFEPVL